MAVARVRRDWDVSNVGSLMDGASALAVVVADGGPAFGSLALVAVVMSCSVEAAFKSFVACAGCEIGAAADAGASRAADRSLLLSPLSLSFVRDSTLSLGVSSAISPSTSSPSELSSSPCICHRTLRIYMIHLGPSPRFT